MSQSVTVPDQGQTCTTPCTTLGSAFSVQLQPAGVTQEAGLFSSVVLCFLSQLAPALLAFIFITRRVEPSLSLVNSANVVGVWHSRAFIALSLSLTSQNLQFFLPIGIRTHDFAS